MNQGDNQRDRSGKGFSGLSSLVSKVEVPAALPEKKPAAEAPKVSPEKPSGSGNGKVVAVTIVILIGLVVLAAWLQSLSDSSRSANVSTKAAAASPAPVHTNQTAAPAQQTAPPPPTPPAFVETKPAPGYGQSLSENEIRYCLAEDIRLDAESAVISQLQKSVNEYRQSDVDRFNAVVNAYNARAEDLNSRCSHYRYYQSAMTRAKADVEQRRSLLVDEGRTRILGKGPSTTTKSSQTSRKASDTKSDNSASAASNSRQATFHVYKCKLENGEIQYTNRPNDKTNCQALPGSFSAPH